jgi:hypothetical protein
VIGVPWLNRRLFPILGTIGLLILGMAGTIWGPRYYGTKAWATPDDLWATLTAAQRLLHGDLGGLYTPPTNLVSFPGAAIILVPVVALIDAVHLPISIPGPPLGANHGVWLVAGCYETVISATVLFVADEIAERLGLSRPKRALLAAASAVALWNVTIRWGHPEDAVATGLLLLAILALSESRTGRAGWLIGAAVAIQPLVLLAIPILLAVIAPRRLPGFLARSAAPAAVLLAAAAAANWHATYTAVTKQPNFPLVDHPTPWLFLAPHLSRGSVAAGPARTLAIVVACGCAIVLALRWRARRRDRTPQEALWTPDELREIVWWCGVALALRCVFESVMVAYYPWPPLALALIAASRSWVRMLIAGSVATTLTFVTQDSWRNTWGWYAMVVVGLAVALWAASDWPAHPAPRQQPLPEPGEQFATDSAS